MKTLKTSAFAVIFFLWIFIPHAGSFVSSQNPLNSDIPCVWTNVKRIVVVGDLHGAYDQFVRILKGTGVVDDGLKWIGKDTHLVQIGDVLDRGDRAKDIFDLLIRLESEAEAAGGKVHTLIGNHEEMNLANTAFEHEGYITPKQFTSFVSERYKKNMEKKFRRKPGRKKGRISEYDFSEEWKRVIDKARTYSKDKGRMNYYRNLNRLYGDWILSKNVAIKINGIVFVHAGITEGFMNWSLPELNSRYREELDAIRKAILTERMPKIRVFEMVFYNARNGPLWTRDFIQFSQKEYQDDVDRILENYMADYMVIGHSPLYLDGKNVPSKFQGKIWVVDTGIGDYYRHRGGSVSALIIEDGKFFTWLGDSE